MSCVNKNSKTFCILPFTSLSVEADGEVKICCMSSDRLEINGNKSINDYSLEDFWNCDQINEVRDALNNNEYHPNCKLCWTEEKVERNSKRIRDNKEHDKLLDNDLSQPQILDLNLGNKCNIACRTCGTHSSTGWLEEEIFFSNDWEKNEIRKRTDHTSKCFSKKNSIWNTLDKWQPKVKHFDFYGGEPMIIQEQWDLIEKSVDKGYAKHQRVHYNTNGTVFRTEYLQWLKEFGWVDIQFSIDGIEDRFEFMRYPAKWKRVFNNIKKYMALRDEQPETVSAGVCLTISNFNVYYIDEVVNFFEKQNIGVYLNLVHWPNHQNITNIPTEVKKKIEEKVRNGLKNIPTEWYAHYGLDNIMNFMNSTKYNIDEYNKWINEIKDHDNYRKQDFTKIFEDYAKILPGF